MRINALLVVLLFLAPLTAYTQPDKAQVINVLSKYLDNSANGKYVGWTNDLQDTLSIFGEKYFDRIKAIDKSLRIVQGDPTYFALSFNLDSIQIKNDYAIGFVSLISGAHGHVIDPIEFKQQKLLKKYFLIKKDDRWFVVAESEDWFISVLTYIKWADKELISNSRSPEINKILTNNLATFKKLLR
jgi:hypothetical protein